MILEPFKEPDKCYEFCIWICIVVTNLYFLVLKT